MSKISFIYFDVGGVFLDWRNVFTTPARDNGVTQKEITDIFEKYGKAITTGKISSDEFWQLCRKELNIPGGKDYNFLDAWISDYIPNKFIYDLASSLGRRYQLGIISNIYQGMYQKLVQKRIIPEGIFTETILSCDVHMRKPDREIYNLAQQRAGVTPQEILFIDDSESSLIIPKELGWETFLYNTKNYNKTNSKLRALLMRPSAA